MSTLWNRSGMVERYADDLRASGAKAFFYVGGTTLLMTVYRDSGGSSAHPSPVVADANGRWPDVFVPYVVSYDVQVKTADDVQLTYTQQIPNPDPVALSVTIPPSSQVQTGMIHAEMVNNVKAGYVRLNGRTIGSAASSPTATERANDDTHDLFIYLWTNLPDSIAPVSGGRSGSAAADFSTGNKTITLPNWQGAGPCGLDDMGAVAGGFFTGLLFNTGSAIQPGSSTGSNGVTLDITNMPAHTHSGSTSNQTDTGTTGIQSVNHTHSGTTGAGSAHQHSAFIGDNHTHGIPYGPTPISTPTSIAATGTPHQSDGQTSTVASGGGGGIAIRSTAGTFTGADNQTATESSHTHSFTSGNQSADHTHSFTTAGHTHTFTTDSKGSGVGFNNLGRTILVTWFIKL